MAEINSLTKLTSPVGTESIPVQEAGGTLERIPVYWFAKATDVAALFSYFDARGAARAQSTIAVTSGSIKTAITNALAGGAKKVSLHANGETISDLPGGGWWNIEIIPQGDSTSYLNLIARPVGNHAVWGAYLLSGGWSTGTSGIWTQVTDASGNAVFPSVATTASAANAYIGANGTTILKSTSSRRYKTNILPLSDSAIIDSMKPVTYTSDPDTVPTDDPDLLHYGFIAEDLAEIDPKLVQYTEDAEGNIIPDGVQYDRITVLLVKRIQELEARLKKAGI